jgi:protein-histidine N-methyltransferase
VPEYRQFPLKEYSEMRMMVASRIFGIQIEGHKTDAFVAYADMLNHRRPRQTGWTYDDGHGGFIIEALEDIKRGEQIYDSYGKKCNTRFLLNYGFINLNNDGNEYPFRVSLDIENDPLFAQKRNLLGAEPIKRTYRAMADLTEENTYKLLSFMRFAEWDGDMLVLAQAKMRDEKAR